MRPTLLLACSLFALTCEAAPPKAARVDDHGDPLPPGAVARLGAARFRHAEMIWGLTYSADGKRMAAGSSDSRLYLWDAETGRESRRFVGHTAAVGRVAFSPDGTLLASAGADKVVRLWEIATGKEKNRFPIPNALGSDVVFAPDGKTLFTQGVDVRAWAVATGELQRTFAHPRGSKVGQMALSADGKLLVTAPHKQDDGTVILWDVAAGEMLRTLEGHPKGVRGLAISPDGKTLATADDMTVRTWDVATGKELLRQLRDWYVTDLTFSPSGMLAAGSGSLTVMWDRGLGHEPRKLNHAGEPASYGPLAFRPDGKVLARAAGSTVRFWEVKTGEDLSRFVGHPAPINSVAVSTDGKTVATGAQDATARLWDVRTSKERLLLDGEEDDVDVTAVAFAGDVLLTSGYNGAPLRRRDACTGRDLGPLKVHRSSVGMIQVSADGKLVASGCAIEYPDIVWEAATGRIVKRYASGGSESLALSPDGRLLANLDAQGIPATFTLREAGTGKIIRQASDEALRYRRLAFSPDSRLLACSRTHDLRVEEAVTGRVLVNIAETPYIQALAFSPDGRTVASVSGKDGGVGPQVIVWEVSTGTVRTTFDGHAGHANALAFSPDGRRVITGGEDGIGLVWDVTGTLLPRAAGERFGAGESAWELLATHDGGKAWPEMMRMTADPARAIQFLMERLRADLESLKRIPPLIAELDHIAFVRRQQASKALQAYGALARVYLEAARANPVSPEAGKRAEELLGKLDPEGPDAEVRDARCVEALELMGTAEARGLLEELAGAEKRSRLANDAKAALRRMPEPLPQPRRTGP